MVVYFIFTVVHVFIIYPILHKVEVLLIGTRLLVFLSLHNLQILVFGLINVICSVRNFQPFSFLFQSFANLWWQGGFEIESFLQCVGGYILYWKMYFRFPLWLHLFQQVLPLLSQPLHHHHLLLQQVLHLLSQPLHHHHLLLQQVLNHLSQPLHHLVQPYPLLFLPGATS